MDCISMVDTAYGVEQMTELREIYCDFHIHVGKSLGKPVKMAAAPSLTLENLLHHARIEKGLDVVTVIDGACTNVLTEVRQLQADGRLVEVSGGGLVYENGLVVILGSEVEVGGPMGGAAHFGCWFDSVYAATDFSQWLGTVQKNVSLSSQRARTDAVHLQRQVKVRDGLFIVHHAFTPHKGLFGNCVANLADMVIPQDVDALELGLSADTSMADCLDELRDFTFVSNSDAHSLPKIAREYNRLQLMEPNFSEVRLALHRMQGRSVSANFGLHPALGKYHRSSCVDCGEQWVGQTDVCACGSRRKVMGVFDRLCDIRQTVEPVHPLHRPPYVHQVPLEFIPGLGPKAKARLLKALQTEMNVLHKASLAELIEAVGEVLALRIEMARTGQAELVSGGAGVYGKMVL
jgi:uncharacterized protein (TIGR00375 family)